MAGRDAEEFDSGYGESSQYAAHLDRGWALLDRGDLGAARTSVAHAQEVRPDDPDASVLQGAIALAEGSPDEALRCYDRAIELDAEYLEPYAAAAQVCLFDLEDPVRALRYCGEALELEELSSFELIDLQLLAAECELARGDVKAAAQRLAQCTELSLLDVAMELAARGPVVSRPAEAEAPVPAPEGAEDERTMIEHFLTRDLDGELLDEDEQTDRVARIFQLAMRLCRVRLDLGEHGRALTHLDRLTSLFPNEADAWYLAGEAHLRMGDARRGAEASLRTLELDAQLDPPMWMPSPAMIHRRVLQALQRADDLEIRKTVADDVPVALLIQDRPGPELVAEGVDPRVLALALGSRPSPEAPLELTAVAVYRANIARVCRDAQQFEDELKLAVVEELHAFLGGAATDPPAAAKPDADEPKPPRRRKRRRIRSTPSN
jgi:tetratricopeptide (TPR) repeat protein